MAVTLPIEFDVELTVAEHYEYWCWWRQHKENLVQRVFGGYLPLALVAGIWMVGAVIPPWDWYRQVVVAAIAVLVVATVAAYGRITQRWSHGRMMRRPEHAALIGPQRFLVTEHEITATDREGDTSLRWSHVAEVATTPSVLLLIIDSRTLMIPRRALDLELEAEILRLASAGRPRPGRRALRRCQRLWPQPQSFVLRTTSHGTT